MEYCSVLNQTYGLAKITIKFYNIVASFSIINNCDSVQIKYHVKFVIQFELAILINLNCYGFCYDD